MRHENCDVKETVVFFQVCSSLEIRVQEIEQIFGDSSNSSSYLHRAVSGPDPFGGPAILYGCFS
jgi:hypothetical protein